MELRIIAVPYDTSLRGFRMGGGPERLLGYGIVGRLQAAGHRVSLEFVEADPVRAPAEIRAGFELIGKTAERVRAALDAGAFPVMLSGNCNSAVGTLSGLSTSSPGIVWFDAHADFNTPETTVGGFPNGMAAATAAGRCWSGIAAAIPGFRPVREKRIVLLGTRDIDPLEGELLEGSRVAVAPPERVRAGLDDVLGPLRPVAGETRPVVLALPVSCARRGRR